MAPAPDFTLMYELKEDWSVADVEKQVVCKQSYQLFPQKSNRVP